MGLLTKPVAKLRRIVAKTTARELEGLLVADLRLDAKPLGALEALDRIHGAVTARCSGRQVRDVSGRTSGHYSYTISPTELHYRESVAAALTWRGEYAAANFYLRFWAYSLARCPVVLEEAGQGKNPSFYVPNRRLKESLLTACPEIIDDVQLVMGGEVTRSQAEESVEGTNRFRELVADEIRAGGYVLGAAEGKADGQEE